MISTGKFRQDRTTVQLGRPCRFARYRLTIQNLDSPPLDIVGIDAKADVHEALFLGKPTAAYRVLYGGQNIEPPRYDIAEVLATARNVDANACTVGPQEPNPLFRPRRAGRLLSGRTFLAVAVILMLCVLGWIIAQTARKVEQLPKD